MQYDRNGRLAGSRDVGISDDAQQALCVGKSIGPVARSGTIRFPSGGGDGLGFELRMRTGDDDQDVMFLGGWTPDTNHGHKQSMSIGGWGDDPAQAMDRVHFRWNELLAFEYIGLDGLEDTVTSLILDQWQHDIEHPYIPPGERVRALVCSKWLNFAILGTRDHYANPYELFGHGNGVFYLGRAWVEPYEPTTLGIAIYCASTDRPYARTPADTVVPMFSEGFAAELETDVMKIDTAFTDLLSVVATTRSGVLDVEASVSGLATTSPGSFRLTVDGVPVPHGSMMAVGGASMSLLKHVTGLSPLVGHAIALQWAAQDIGSVAVRPASAPNTDHATLIARPSS